MHLSSTRHNLASFAFCFADITWIDLLVAACLLPCVCLDDALGQ